MSSEITEPVSGTPHPDTSADVTGHDTAPGSLAVPGVTAPPPRTGSTDELALDGNPDPLLGEFDPETPPPNVAEATVGPGDRTSSAELAALDMEKPLPLQPLQPPGSFEAVAPLAEPVATHPAEAVSEPPPAEGELTPRSGSVDDLTALTMTSEPPAPLVEAAARPLPQPFGGIDLSAPPSAPQAAADNDDADDDYDEPRGLPLWVVLLMSYASALTIGVLYVVITGRTFRRSEEADFLPPIDQRVDPGQRARFSRKLEPPPPIKPEHLTTLGKPIRVGSLEVTPVEITADDVVLRHMIGDAETRKEGSDALKLRLRLRNLSNDLVFAPLDEAFLREREAGVTDSFIELPEGPNIELYPLAVTSEWAIDGQEFKELAPGKTLETQVVTDRDARQRVAPEMTWRIRLRTGKDQTDSIGVRFTPSDIKPRS
jgi:hypothetical protein